MSKRKRPEESTLFNDINNNNMDGNDSVSLITPSSNPFNLVSPQSLLPTFLKAEQNGNGSNGTQSRPFPTLDTPPTQNQTPGIFSTPSNYMSIDTPTELTNEQHVFTMFRSNTSTVPPFGTDRLQTPGFDIPTPVLTGEHFQQPIPQASEKLVQQATLLSSISHQPPPPPTNTANLPPLPKPLPRERETRESKRRRPATPPDTDEDTDDEDSNNSSPATSSTISSSSSAPPVTGGNTNSFFHIADGLNKNSNVKYLGGKQNNQYPMPPQTIEVIWNNLPRLYTDQLGLKGLHQLVCRCYVLGFDRQKRSMVSLSKVSSDKRFHETPEKRWVAVFNDIFVQYASHNYGQRLALRFQLVMIDNDDEERVLCQTDSTEFQTITKRGLEKEQQRERNRIEKHKYGAVVETVEPAIGFPVGNQLVKIYLSGIVGDSNASSNNNPQFLAQSQVTVYFGEQPSPEVHSVKKNIIICETPEHMPGEVDVVVSLVKKDNVGTCLTSKAKFRYVDPNDREALALVLRHYATKSIVKHDE